MDEISRVNDGKLKEFYSKIDTNEEIIKKIETAETKAQMRKEEKVSELKQEQQAFNSLQKDI